MRYLVIGAGVLGGYLAHELYQGGKDVTLLVTPRRYQEIAKDGLRIQHIRQKNETVDCIPVITQLKSSDYYDVVFVVVQKSQMEEVINLILDNLHIQTVILVGNNAEATKTYKYIMARSKNSLEVLFGFLSCGGRRENGIIYNWHGDSCNLTIGAVTKDKQIEYDVMELEKGCNLHVRIMRDMDAWLKYHVAIITPICLAIEIEHGNTKGLLHSSAIKLSIDAVKECTNFYKQQEYFLEPTEELKLLRKPTWLIHILLAVLLPTKTGHIIAVYHAMAGQQEINVLANEILSLAREKGIKLNCLTSLLVQLRMNC